MTRRLTQIAFICILMALSALMFSAAFAGEEGTKNCEGEACCAAKMAAAKDGDTGLAACTDGGPGAFAVSDRPAEWPRVGITLADGTYYPVNTCLVTGEMLNPESPKLVVAELDGRTVVYCCPGCQPSAEADPARFIANLDEMIIAQQSADYPLTVCPVSEQELGGMGEPANLVVDNFLVKVCCAGCGSGVKADPTATLAALKEFWSKPVEVETVQVAQAE